MFSWFFFLKQFTFLASSACNPSHGPSNPSLRFSFLLSKFEIQGWWNIFHCRPPAVEQGFLPVSTLNPVSRSFYISSSVLGSPVNSEMSCCISSREHTFFPQQFCAISTLKQEHPSNALQTQSTYTYVIKKSASRHRPKGHTGDEA